jgi:curved DNA-binding protein CbpA
MKPLTSLYDILQVPHTASCDEIRAAFRKLAKIHHPDKNDSAGSEHDFILIHNAYEILSDADTRSGYDAYFGTAGVRDAPGKNGSARLRIGEPASCTFTMDDILGHINYFLWDIEIMLTREYKRYFDMEIGAVSFREHILRILLFIDKWILYPAGFRDYFMQSRDMKDISFSEYVRMIDDPLKAHRHRPFYSLNDYFYNVRKRIDQFINTVTVKDLHSSVPGHDIRLLDCIIEAQNYALHVIGSLKRARAGDAHDIRPFVHSKEFFTI